MWEEQLKKSCCFFFATTFVGREPTHVLAWTYITPYITHSTCFLTLLWINPCSLKNQLCFHLPFPVNSQCLRICSVHKPERKLIELYTTSRKIDEISPKSLCILKAWLIPETWESDSRTSGKNTVTWNTFCPPLAFPSSRTVNCFQCSPSKAFDPNKSITQYTQKIL